MISSFFQAYSNIITIHFVRKSETFCRHKKTLLKLKLFAKKNSIPQVWDSFLLYILNSFYCLVFYLTNKQLRVKELADLKKMEGKYPISKETEIGSFPGPDFDLPSVMPVEASINKDITGDYIDNIFSSPIVELKDEKLPELQVGDIITLKFDSNTAQYLSND